MCVYTAQSTEYSYLHIHVKETGLKKLMRTWNIQESIYLLQQNHSLRKLLQKNIAQTPNTSK